MRRGRGVRERKVVRMREKEVEKEFSRVRKGEECGRGGMWRGRYREISRGKEVGM
jgi:hypothetical protein